MEFIKIGFIRKPHGLKGEVKILPLTDNPARYKKSLKTYLLINNEYIPAEIEHVKNTGDTLIIKFTNYNSIEAAETLRSVYIFIDRQNADPLAEDEYYTQDLIDCTVLYQDQSLGKVKDVFRNASTDLIVINCKSKEVLFPLLKIYIDAVDIKQKKIMINQYEGFFD